MTSREKYELLQKINSLPTVERLQLVEDVLRDLRKSMIDPREIERGLDEMIADPEFQRMMRGEEEERYDAAG